MKVRCAGLLLLFAVLLPALGQEPQQPLPALSPAEEIHKAARGGDLERVRQLLPMVPVNHRDNLGGTLLHDAAWAGEAKVAELLLDRGADVNARHLEGGSTPLHYAVTTNHPEVVKILIARGADVHATYRSGSTPLHLAANRGFERVAQMLLDRGAKVNAIDQAGARPLDEAAWRGNTGMLRLLIQAGAGVKDANAKTGETALHLAASKGHYEAVEILLEAGADAAARDATGATVLDDAIHYQHARVTDLLVSRGARLDGAVRVLHEAILRGQYDLVTTLAGRIELDKAIQDGATPLHSAALKGRTEIAAFLISKGCNVNARNTSGATPLHDAALGGFKETAALLLEHGAEIDAQDAETGSTPLHQAASWGRKDVVELLLARKANAALRTKSGKLAADLAREAGHEEIARLLP